MLLFCIWLLAWSPAWLLLSGQEKCWVTWPESQGLNLGVMGFLKVYWSECLNGLLGACASLDAGFRVDLCLLMDLCVCLCIPVSASQCCLIGRFEYYCSWQEVFSLFLLGWLNRLASFPYSALDRNTFKDKIAMNRQYRHVHVRVDTACYRCAGPLAAQGMSVIVDANICMITCLILVPSGIASNFVRSFLQMHRHTHGTSGADQSFWAFAFKCLRFVLKHPLSSLKAAV